MVTQAEGQKVIDNKTNVQQEMTTGLARQRYREDRENMIPSPNRYEQSFRPSMKEGGSSQMVKTTSTKQKRAIVPPFSSESRQRRREMEQARRRKGLGEEEAGGQ